MGRRELQAARCRASAGAVLCSLVCVVLAVPSMAPSAEPAQKPTSDLIGIVDRISGRWSITHDDRPLRVRSPIYAGDTIATRDQASASITVYLVAAGKPWSVSCSNETPCKATYKPASQTSSGLWAFVTSFVVSEGLLDRILPAARSASTGGPTHALVNRSEGTVDLTPALEHLPPGSYTVSLKPITDTGSEATGREASVRVGDNANTTVGTLEAGLYRLRVADQSGEAVGLPVVVLALDDDPEAHAIWKDAVAQTTAWTTAGQGTIDSALVRVLFALNERRRRG